MLGKRTLKLNKSLCERAAVYAEKSGYSSLEEFVEHLVEKELARSEETVSEEDIRKRLKGLGYLD